jgi:hypothetical protein
LRRATRRFSKVACDLTERKRAEEAVDEVQWTERELLAHDLYYLVLQDLAYALQAGEVIPGHSERR